ncbi:GroES-like protein [Xylaria sp. CBS 124048]|nr:GroES-like protein [Xylaria sp. CBS 124048]
MATTQKALVITGKGKAEIQTVPVPKVRDGYLLVKVRAAAINPTDWKTIDSAEENRFGSRPGCDYAGEVVELGPGVTRDFKKGDRITGFLFGGHPSVSDSGAYAEYTLAKTNVALKVPDHVTDAEAATLGISVTTVAQGLYQTLKLPLPNKPAATPFPVLVYGGSTATGIYAIKFLKLSGLTVIATSSPKNFELLKSVGADHVFDYKSPTVGADIRKLTNNKLKYAWDCTGYGGAICAAALSDNEEGGKPTYGTIIPVQREVIDKVNPIVDGPHFTLGYRALGTEEDGIPDFLKALPGDVEYARTFWDMTQELINSGKLTPLRPEVNRGGSGLEGILNGLEELRKDRVSGTKLVYTF